MGASASASGERPGSRRSSGRCGPRAKWSTSRWAEKSGAPPPGPTPSPPLPRRRAGTSAWTSGGSTASWVSGVGRELVQAAAHGDELADQIHEAVEPPEVHADVPALRRGSGGAVAGAGGGGPPISHP